jgi:hypothetical protein
MTIVCQIAEQRLTREDQNNNDIQGIFLFLPHDHFESFTAHNAFSFRVFPRKDLGGQAYRVPLFIERVGLTPVGVRLDGPTGNK